jgi:hypothetical protein
VCLSPWFDALSLWLLCVRARVRDRAQVDDAVEARVVEQPAPVQVAEDAHVVGAVREQRVPLALLRELDGLQAAAGLDGDLVVLAEQVEAEGVRGPEEAEAHGFEDVGRLQEPGGGRLRRELQRRVQEGDVEAHAVEGAEGVRCIEGRDELAPEPRLVLRLAGPHAPELVRAPLARVVVLRADDGDNAVCRVDPGGLDVEGDHARAVWAGASSSLFCRSLESAGETCGAKSAVCIKRRSGMPARGTYDEPDRRNQYLTWQSGLTKDGLLTAFYMPVLELARLMQATAVPQLVIPDIIAFTISGITDIIAISNISTYTIGGSKKCKKCTQKIKKTHKKSKKNAHQKFIVKHIKNAKKCTQKYKK